MKPITEVNLELTINADQIAMNESPETAKTELLRMLDVFRSRIESDMSDLDDEIYEHGSIMDLNGVNSGSWSLEVLVNDDVIDDADEWCAELREEVAESGLQLTSQTMYNLDEAYELDPDWVNEWFSNRTDAAIIEGKVVPEASGWEFS